MNEVQAKYSWYITGGPAEIHGLPIAFSYNGVLGGLLLVTGTAASHICSWFRLLQQWLLLWLFLLNEPRTLQKWVELDGIARQLGDVCCTTAHAQQIGRRRRPGNSVKLLCCSGLDIC